jgi:hypothetical protein
MNECISSWLLDQAPVIVVMGVVIWWLAKRLTKAEDEKKELAANVIKLTTLWEAKTIELTTDDEISKEFRKETISLLKEIKITLNNK